MIGRIIGAQEELRDRVALKLLFLMGLRKASSRRSATGTLILVGGGFASTARAGRFGTRRSRPTSYGRRSPRSPFDGTRRITCSIPRSAGLAESSCGRTGVSRSQVLRCTGGGIDASGGPDRRGGRHERPEDARRPVHGGDGVLPSDRRHLRNAAAARPCRREHYSEHLRPGIARGPGAEARPGLGGLVESSAAARLVRGSPNR